MDSGLFDSNWNFFPGFYEKSRCSITQIITTNRSIANVSQNKQTKQKTFKNLKVVNTPLGKCPLKFNVEHTVLCNLFFYLEELKIRSNQWKTWWRQKREKLSLKVSLVSFGVNTKKPLPKKSFRFQSIWMRIQTLRRFFKQCDDHKQVDYFHFSQCRGKF